LCANPGTKAYGALSVEAQARAEASVHLHVPPDRFHPRPKVDSAVVRLDLRPAPEVGSIPLDQLDTVVRAAFAYRRKTLLNSLAARFGREESARALGVAGIAPTLRAERLDLAAFGALARAFFPG
jgi:16S rRNA (adenine1518-N6/adenine1519-N6)-dimethyltransferase